MEKGMYVTIQQGTVNVELQAHRQALGHRLFWFFMPRIRTRALCMLGKHSTVEVFHEPVYLLVFVACMCVLLRRPRYVAQADLRLLCSSYSCNSRDYRCMLLHLAELGLKIKAVKLCVHAYNLAHGARQSEY